MTNLKVGFCVAYDWLLLKRSLPLVYPYADRICLSLDKERKSWSGEPYAFDEVAFHEFLRSVDIEKKIDVYEDCFFLPELTPIENDNRQRLLMSQHMGDGGWHIQIDSDEYFLDFKGFAEFLKNRNDYSGKAVNISCQWISIFKKVAGGYLIVDNSDGEWESMPFATNKPEYLNARRNSHFNVVSPFFVIHETWSRSREELVQKLNSWGHHNDFLDKDKYLKFWDNMDDFNYKYVHKFHPLKPEVWKKLLYIQADSIEVLIKKIRESDFINVSGRYLFFRNSRNWNRFISILNKFGIKSRN